MTFEEYARPGTCEVCGANGLTVRTMVEFFASWSDYGHDLEDLIEEEF